MMVDQNYMIMWYLSEQLVVFSICDESLSLVERSKISKALISSDRPQIFTTGKPEFNVGALNENEYNDVSLSAFVGPMVVVDF